MGKEERHFSLLGTNSTSAAGATRFLSVLPQPHPNTADDEDLELSESDVVWSPISTKTPSSQPQSVAPLPSEPEQSLYSISIPEKLVSENSISSPSYSKTTPNGRNYPSKNRSFHHERFGLPAVLAEEPKSLSPTISAIKAVPPLFRFSTGVDSSVVNSGSGRLYQMSAPVNVPVWPTKGNVGELIDEVEDEAFGDEKGNEEEDMVPPHIMVARSHRMTFSVFEGVGRTLKGRDLRRVRNAVLQKTGFLD